MKMVERVARAICVTWDNPDADEVDGRKVWETYVPEASAAIEAMREPSDDSITAACDASDLFRLDYIRAHEAMIDAALKEQP